MEPASHAFQIGDIACHVLLDGGDTLDRERFMRRFPQGTEAEYREAYESMGLSLDDADSSLNILLAQIAGEMVLVDSGMGYSPGGLLPESLRLTGIAPEAVSMVVITHSHGDHVMGLLHADGQPVFPNAQYAISSVEWAWWQVRVESTQPEQRAITAMMEERGLRLLAMDEVILPGLAALPIPGHTPGQIGLVFESAGEHLLHLADLLHSPMQIARPDWSAAFDADKSVSVPSRQAALARAADEDALVMFYHLTFPGLGRVQRQGSAFAWSPSPLNR